MFVCALAFTRAPASGVTANTNARFFVRANARVCVCGQQFFLRPRHLLCASPLCEVARVFPALRRVSPRFARLRVRASSLLTASAYSAPARAPEGRLRPRLRLRMRQRIRPRLCGSGLCARICVCACACHRVCALVSICKDLPRVRVRRASASASVRRLACVFALIPGTDVHAHDCVRPCVYCSALLVAIKSLATEH